MKDTDFLEGQIILLDKPLDWQRLVIFFKSQTLNLKMILFIFLLLSCGNEKIKYSGFEDLTIGTNTINLFEDNKFEIEIGLGYSKGNYHIISDTIFLKYNKNSKLPTKILMNKQYFETIPDEFNTRKIKIRRIK